MNYNCGIDVEIAQLLLKKILLLIEYYKICIVVRRIMC